MRLGLNFILNPENFAKMRILKNENFSNLRIPVHFRSESLPRMPKNLFTRAKSGPRPAHWEASSHVPNLQSVQADFPASCEEQQMRSPHHDLLQACMQPAVAWALLVMVPAFEHVTILRGSFSGGNGILALKFFQ